MTTLLTARRWRLGAIAAGLVAALAMPLAGCSRVPGDPPAAGGLSGAPVVMHWGSFFGAVHGNFDTRFIPARIRLPGPVRQVGTSNSTQYALLANGTVYAWGLGTEGQLGNGGTANSFIRPVRVAFPAGVKIAWIPGDVMPYDTGLAVDTTGHVWGWGKNGHGQLCTGRSGRYLRPVRLPLSQVTALAGASNHAIYASRGTVYACGQNVEGDLGTGSRSSTTTPEPVVGLSHISVRALVASFANSGALLTDGRYLDWGYNRGGQLGSGHKARSSDVPVQVRLPLAVHQVAQGGSIWANGQTLAMLSDGSVWAWGSNRNCQLGTGTTGVRSKPVKIGPPAGLRYSQLATGSATSYAVTPDGQLYAWGVSHVGQLGDGLTATLCAPVLVGSNVAGISATANNVVTKLAG